jgi:hypothetical protein
MKSNNRSISNIGIKAVVKMSSAGERINEEKRHRINGVAIRKWRKIGGRRMRKMAALAAWRKAIMAKMSSSKISEISDGGSENGARKWQ